MVHNARLLRNISENVLCTSGSLVTVVRLTSPLGRVVSRLATRLALEAVIMAPLKGSLLALRAISCLVNLRAPARPLPRLRVRRLAVAAWNAGRVPL